MVILEKDVEGIIWNSTIEQLKAHGLDDDSFWSIPSLLKGKYPSRCGLNDFLAYNYDMTINGLTFHRQDVGLCCDTISEYMCGVAEKHGKIKVL